MRGCLVSLLLVSMLGFGMMESGSLPEAIAQTASDRKTEAERLQIKGVELLRLRDAENALKFLQQALALYREIPDPQSEAYALGNIGSVYIIRKDYRKAIEFFEQSLSIARQFKDKDVEKEVLEGLGNAYERLEDYPKAIDYYQQKLTLLRELKDRKAEARVLDKLGNTYYFWKNYEKAISFHQQALEFFRSLKHRKDEGDALGNLGLAYAAKQDYIKAIDYFQQNLIIVQGLKDREGEIHTLGNLGNALFDAKEYQKAIEYRQKSLQFAVENNDREEKAIALGNLGNIYVKLQNYSKAINYYQQSLRITTSIKNQMLSEQTLQSLGETYDSLEDYLKAVQYYQQSLSIAKELKNRGKEEELLKLLGIASLNAGFALKSVEYLQQGLAIARETKNRKSEGEFLIDIGRAYKYSNNYQNAIESCSQGLIIEKELKDQELVSTALNNLGDIYTLTNDYAQAIDYLQQSLVTAQSLQDQALKSQLQLRTLFNLADIYSFLGDEEKALKYAQQSLSLTQRVSDKIRRMESLKQVGTIYLDLRDFKQAISLLGQSLNIAREIKDKGREIDILNDLGNVYYNFGQPNETLRYFQQALKLSQKFKYSRGEGAALAGLGTVYSGLILDLPKAVDAFQRSLVIIREGKDSENEFGLLTNLGRTFFMSHNFLQAEITLREAIKVGGSLRAKLSGKDTEKVLFQDQMGQTYSYLQSTLIAQNKVNAALEVSEQGRTRALIDLLAARISPLSPTQPATNRTLNVQQIQQIAKEQNATLIEYSIVYKPAKMIVEDLFPNVPLSMIDTRVQSELFMWVIKPTGEITFRQVDFDAFQKKKKGSPSVPNFVSDLVSITQQSIGVRGTGRSDINIALSPESLQQMQEQQNLRLRQIHQLLIEPISDLLPSDPNQRIIFIPQESLFLVPFSALQDANGKYLIEKHTILTAPSIQVLQETRQLQVNRKREIGKDNALVVGNPVMPKVVLNPGETGHQLTPLPGAEREAIAIAPLLNTKAITGSQATKAVIVEKMPQASIIHLATHGILDNLRGLGSAIALAPDPTQPPQDKFGRSNGLLTAEEILGMRLNADLIVLSACDTGRGRITGDGVIGLSRSLFVAGVPSVIVSLWKVPDDSTAFLMTEFYRNWRDRHLDKAQALRQAMLTTKAQAKYSQPLDWAAFTLIGEAE